MRVPLQRESPWQLQFSLNCELDAVRPMTESVREFLAKEGASDEELMACELSLAEACNNAVRYVTEAGRTLPVEVEINLDESKIELKIQDHTCGFELPEQVILPSDESESGRGLFLMKSLMDEVHYFRGHGQNEMILHKRRSASRFSPVPPADISEKKSTEISVAEYQKKLAENEQIIHDLSEELNSCYESLAAIFRWGAEMGKTENLEKVSRTFCQDLLQIIGADWFVLRIALENESRLMVFTSSEPKVELDSLILQRELIHFSVETKAALTRQDVWFGHENPLPTGDPLFAFQAGSSGLVHPCFFAGTLVGTLTVGKVAGRRPFTSGQSNIIHTFADFLAIQIINSRLREDHVGHRLVSHELHIAKNIQRALLPKTLPRLAGFELAGYCESARQVGGDFFDALQV
ncbi:MAG: ATP-binding protein, partial [Verrucomicrobiota bacterium]|nr:ATP-binding protein [Verrucomicrobiota bacterium]